MDHFTKTIRDKFKNIYSIDLEHVDDVVIDGMVFPNYFIKNILTIEHEFGYRPFEFCRILNKIFGFDYERTKLSYYEIPDVKLESDDIVFDCGANDGIFSLYSAYKAKEVYAFEPGTLIRHYLKYTQKYNDKIIIVPAGLSNVNKEEYFYQTDNPGAARFEGYEIPWYHRVLYREKAKLITIDDFVDQTGIIPTFIKMDIEDGEIAALKGAQKTLSTYKPKCSISIHASNKEEVEHIKNLFPENYELFFKKEEFYDLLVLGREKQWQTSY